MTTFKLKRFSLSNERSALKIGTDSILLGAIASVNKGCERIIDVGTGTGIVALMLAQRHPTAQVLGVEVDRPSYEEAAENFAASPWSERLVAQHADFLQTQFTVDRHTLVISNPPYYEEDTVSPYAHKAKAKSTTAGFSYRNIFDKFSTAGNKPQISLILPYNTKSSAFLYARSNGFFPCKCVNIKTLEHKPFTRIVVDFCGDRNTVLEETDLTLFTQNNIKTPQYELITKDFQ